MLWDGACCGSLSVGAKLQKNGGKVAWSGGNYSKILGVRFRHTYIGSALRAEILQNLYRIKQNLGRSPGRGFLYLGALRAEINQNYSQK